MSPVLIGSLGVLGNPTAILSRIVKVLRPTADQAPQSSNVSTSMPTVSMDGSAQPAQQPSIWSSGYFLSRLSSAGSRVVSELSHGAVESMVSVTSVSGQVQIFVLVLSFVACSQHGCSLNCD